MRRRATRGFGVRGATGRSDASPRCARAEPSAATAPTPARAETRRNVGTRSKLAAPSTDSRDKASQVTLRSARLSPTHHRNFPRIPSVPTVDSHQFVWSNLGSSGQFDGRDAALRPICPKQMGLVTAFVAALGRLMRRCSASTRGESERRAGARACRRRASRPRPGSPRCRRARSATVAPPSRPEGRGAIRSSSRRSPRVHR